MEQRINKYMADKGWCSRRQADEWIVASRVRLNGQLVEGPGLKVDPDKDTVEVDFPKSDYAYFLLNKPLGYLSTVSENEGQSLLRLLPQVEGLFPVGRLDKDSSGLIVVTSDRTITNLLIGETSEVEKEYEVTLRFPLTEGAMRKIESGLNLAGEKLRPCVVRRTSSLSARITLTEGKNRQVRRVFQKIGNEVLTLNRIRIGKLTLRNLSGQTFASFSREDLLKLLA